MVENRFAEIERARRILTEERERTVEEQRALGEFRSEIRELEPAVSPASSGEVLTDVRTGTANRFHAGSGPGTTTSTQQRVIETYRETVMQLDHYQEEYGNTVAADIVMEFGDRIAYALFEARKLPPGMYRLLLTSTRQSIQDRTDLLQVIDRERDSLRTCSTALAEIADRFTELAEAGEPADSETVADLERRCRRIVDRRQELLHSRSKPELRGVTDTSLNNYLYGQRTSVTCPVLHDAVSLWRELSDR